MTDAHKSTDQRRCWDVPAIDPHWPLGPAKTCNGQDFHRFGATERSTLPISIELTQKLSHDDVSIELPPFLEIKRCERCGFEQRRYSIPQSIFAEFMYGAPLEATT